MSLIPILDSGVENIDTSFWTMAPSTGKPVKLLVANKKVMETEKTWNKLEYPVFRGTDGVYFIDDEDVYDEVLHSMAAICKKPVTRIYYIDSDNDEVPIDGDVEFKEALKFIGERTDKGKFTTMKIETENGLKNGKKKVKKNKAKVTPKVSENGFTKKPMKGMPKRVKADAPPNIEPLSDEAFASASKSEISKAWLEKHLKELKTEIMTDLETLLEPYIAEQKKMNSMIASLQAAQIEKTSSVLTNLKQQTESDHNYSASSNSSIVKSAMTLKKDSADTIPKPEDDIPLSDDEQGNDCDGNECQCADCTCPIEDDENMSIYSGEISVTESESEPDQIREDFIDVPLPSCFNVIAPGGFLCKPDQKNRNEMVAKPETSKNRDGSRHPKENFGNKKNSSFQECSKKISAKQVNKLPKEQTTLANFSGSGKKANISQNQHDEKTIDIQSAGNDMCKDVDDSYVDNADEAGQDFDDYDDDDDYDEYDDEYDEENDDKNNMISSSAASYQLQLNQPTGQLSESAQRQEFVQATDTYQQVQKYASSQEDTSAASQYTSQYSTLPVAYGASWPKKPHFPAQTRQGLVNSKQSVQLSVPAQNSFRQESQQIQKLQQPYQQHHQQQMTNSQPLVPKSSPTAATIIAQHQQIVQAAQRAAYQAQQTQALCFASTSQTQQEVSVNQTSAQGGKPALQDTRPLAFQDDNVSFGSQASRSNTSQAENPISRNLPSKTRAMPRFMQEAAHELKLWNEVDQVDLELRKWVKMCQYLMERPPKIIEDGEKSKKFSPAAAAKTYQDLERVYQKFRKEVQLVSTQIDAQKQQKQQLQASGQKLSEDPIAILPEKLMQIISSTLNTTFNLLGHISKLGVMNPPSSETPDENAGTPVSTSRSSTSLSSAKPQQQISAAISPLISGMGNVRVGYTGQPIPYTYYYPVQTLATDSSATPSSSIQTDTVGNQDSSFAYRTRTMGIYPPSWGQSASSFTTTPALSQVQTAMQVTSHNQLQQQQPQALMQTQFQLTQPQIRQLQQQVQPQLQQQMQVQQLQQQIQPLTPMQPMMQQPPHLQQIAREDGSRLDSSYTLQMHDPSMAHDTHNTTISILYPNLKPNSSGFCTKSYGPALNRN
ncbi:uncharacterized protein LOC113212797 isoform X1 [Frankliniella occidentalis]|uniref:Uncharacterized protein LOC113212797 isoform X1 n=2 Tax=Frankliniella occidentalis TaxID=133901 RepID=A0A9C6XA37_FRAOC|nr:uncharacterized protein LOC113212797 isoform X1 [Frankliniella occidentalis]